MKTEPTTLIQAIKHFADPAVTHETIVGLRWPNGVHCPTCGRTDVRFISTRRMWECKEKHPKKQFSSKIGTIFEDSPLGLDKWFSAIWMIANCKNGISSYEMHRALGVTQKSAWFMLHRIRLAMQAGSILKMDTEVEADESFLGGLSKNMHKAKRKTAIKGTGGTNKTAVMGILQRKTSKKASRVRAVVIPNVKAATLQPEIHATVEPGTIVHTDAWVGYRGLSHDFQHEVIDHAIEYVNGTVHTNGIENFWSLLKRTIKGTYVSVEPFHLGRYLDEQSFRFNERKDNDAGRFKTVLSSVFDKRLTYKELIGNAAEAKPH
ncbi:IS1595 family transposase [Nitrobacter sp. TKz-YC02]|uniref:IS1595 family transposase n=1 Tax=Nitrobacter sp. TKz-YC02 TaxID=3398704 RepID=UPI003CF22F85